MSEVLALIPARAGSKGVPGKNSRLVCGAPLWVWSAVAAHYASTVDRIAVTTDDPDIAALARSLNIEVVDRPAELATDTASLDSALVHAVDALGHDGVVVVLQPTVPVRRPGLVDDCVNAFRTFPATRSLITVNRTRFLWNEGGILLNGPRVNRQEHDNPLWEEDGSIFVCNASDLRATGERVMKPVTLYETPRTVDIDTEDDFVVAEALLGKGTK